MVLYLFSGLGADQRAYFKLNFTKYEVKHIEWITPEIGESLSGYAKRLSDQIKSTPCIFIGLSFGGIMAIEMAKYVKPYKIILISSVKSREELPFYFKWFRNLKLYRLIPDHQLISSNSILDYLFGIYKKEDRKLLSDIMKDSDPDFVRWAMGQINRWENEEVFDNLVHIHGSNDRIFPLKFVKPDIVIQGGGHFMIVDHSKEIEEKIINIIERK